MAPLRCAATGSTGRIAKDGPWSQKKQFFMIIFVVWVFLRCFFFLFLNVLSVLLLVLQLLCFLLILCCVFVCVPVPEHFRPGCFDACRLLFFVWFAGIRSFAFGLVVCSPMFVASSFAWFVWGFTPNKLCLLMCRPKPRPLEPCLLVFCCLGLTVLSRGFDGKSLSLSQFPW